MKIIVNGNTREFKQEELVLQDVIDSLKSNTQLFVVFRNEEFIDRLQYLKLKLEDGDEITIFPLLQGA
ncbi:MAG TPA: sulfur carrier protein ThiS [Bacteroidales bacterium]|nr:sulfur carrier protein ThiS [Bacteroidales bacterium]